MFKGLSIMSPPSVAPALSSLRRRSNVTLVSNVCEAAPRSLFWAPNGFNELSEVFRISFHPDWQIENGIFNRPIIGLTQILVHGWSWNKDFGAVSQTDMWRRLLRVPSGLLLLGLA